nr:MAG: putative RNA dependent RNA polymerase [Tombusviridae sp.]
MFTFVNVLAQGTRALLGGGVGRSSRRRGVENPGDPINLNAVHPGASSQMEVTVGNVSGERPGMTLEGRYWMHGLLEPVPRVCFEGREMLEVDESRNCSCVATRESMPCDKDNMRAGLWHKGPATPYMIPQMSESCQHNELIAVRNRATYKTPPMNLETFERFKEWMHKYRGYLFGDQRRKCKAATFRQWVDHIAVPAKRRLMEQGRLEEDTGAHTESFEEIRGFTKREKILKDEPYDPRFIQGRSIRYTQCVGPLLWSAGKILGDVWGPTWSTKSSPFNADPMHRCPQLFYATGGTREHYGQWYDVACDELVEFCEGGDDLVVLENDFSRFDSTISAEMLGLERSVYEWMFKIDAKVLRALRSQDVTVGRTKNGVKYACNGGRHSGDANTSVGNTILNGAASLWIACEVLGEAGQPLAPWDVPMRGIYGGDDSYVLMPRTEAMKLSTQMARYYTELGWRPKCKLVETYEAEFYSATFVPTAEGTVLLPKPGRVLAKAFYAMEDYSDLKARGWARQIAENLHTECSVFPWMKVILGHMTKKLGGVERYTSTKDRLAMYHKSKCARAHTMCPETWRYLGLRYGIGSGEVRGFRRWFMLQASQLPDAYFVSHSLLRVVHEADVGGLPAD